MNICIFGDSVARGVIYDEEKKKYIFSKGSFVKLFEKERQTSVKNFAKFGCTTSKGEEILDTHTKELGTFDYTILEFGGNDCDYNWKNVSDAPGATHLPNVPIKQFTIHYKNMIEKVKSDGSQPILLSLPPLDANRFFRCISAGLNKENILKFIHDINFIYRWQELYNAQIFEIANKCNVPVIDIRKEFLKNKNYQACLCSDGMHPNEKGHRLILDALLKFVKTI